MHMLDLVEEVEDGPGFSFDNAVDHYKKTTHLRRISATHFALQKNSAMQNALQKTKIFKIRKAYRCVADKFCNGLARTVITMQIILQWTCTNGNCVADKFCNANCVADIICNALGRAQTASALQICL